MDITHLLVRMNAIITLWLSFQNKIDLLSETIISLLG